jgi:hypothetical protein
VSRRFLFSGGAPLRGLGERRGVRCCPGTAPPGHSQRFAFVRKLYELQLTMMPGEAGHGLKLIVNSQPALACVNEFWYGDNSYHLRELSPKGIGLASLDSPFKSETAFNLRNCSPITGKLGRLLSQPCFAQSLRPEARA